MADENDPSLVKKKQEEAPLEIYYDYVYKIRGEWTKYGIPVSFTDPRSGFVVEGLIYAPGKRILSKRTYKVKIKYAFDPPRLANIVQINSYDIYPTKRRITKVEDSKLVETKVVPEFKDLKVRSPISFTKIKDIYDSYYGVNWTARELCSILERPDTDVPKIQELPFMVKVGSRVCKISSEIADTYTIQTPEEMKEKNDKNKWSIEKLNKEYSDCTKCSLGSKRKARGCSIVPGRGDPNAKLFIIGEAPGVQEEQNGIAFYPGAPAGGVLERVMKAARIQQSECYITNSVLCRPEPDTGSSIQNGKPEPEHIAACGSRLKMELLLTGAKVVLILGAYAYRSFFGTSVRGRIEDNIGWQKNMGGDYKVYLTYHPSYIIRTLDFEPDPEKQILTKNMYKACFDDLRKELDEQRKNG